LVVVVGEGFIGLRCRQQRGLFLLAQFGLAMDHRHGLLNIEQLEITDTPQRKIILVGHLSERLIIHSAVFAECLNAHVFGERGPAFRWRQQNGFHLTFVNFGQASHLA
jgi:hypothetical protein